MNRRVIVVIIILGVLGILLTTGILMSNQNRSPDIVETEISPVPAEQVIASYAQDQIYSKQPVSADNLSSANALIAATEGDIDPYFYPNGPVIAYGRDMQGSIVVWMDKNQTVNQTVINEIYEHISAKGKMYHNNSVPCRFISTGHLKLDVIVESKVPYNQSLSQQER